MFSTDHILIYEKFILWCFSFPIHPEVGEILLPAPAWKPLVSLREGSPRQVRIGILSEGDGDRLGWAGC